MRLSPHSPRCLCLCLSLSSLSPHLSPAGDAPLAHIGRRLPGDMPGSPWEPLQLGPGAVARTMAAHGCTMAGTATWATARRPMLASSSQVAPPGATSHGSVKASANSAPCSQLWFASIAWPAWPALGCLARLGSHHLTSTSQPPWCPSALDVPHSMCEAVCIGMTMLPQTTCLVLSSTWLPPSSTSPSPTAPRLQRLPGPPCHRAPRPRPALAHAYLLLRPKSRPVTIF
jgi:hypothetical protein